MVRIVNCCYSNLNYQNIVNEMLGDDITNEVMIGTSPTELLATVNTNRRIVKLYIVELSDLFAKVWIRHGNNTSTNNAAFPLPFNKFYENTLQASRPLSVACTIGTALLRLSVVNKL